ncbi:MAG TPA: glycosyltransferase family 39 protein, partial [bacterium]|nr:glycosyltransferase family 39 protein [bacterium]
MTQDGDDLTTAQRDWWRQCGAATAAMLLPVLGCLAYAGGLPKLPDYVREAMQAALVVLAALVLGAVPAARLLPAQPLWFLLGAMACGYAVLSLAGLLLGVAGLLYVPILLALPAAVAVAGLRRWRWFVQRLTPEALALAADERLLLVLFALLALLNLAAAFSPVIFYDALVYHLNIPAEYLRAHRILLLPHNLHSNLPLGMSMLYLFTLPVPSGVPAQLLNCLFSLLAAGAAYVLARQWCERRRALLAMLLFQTLPVNALFATLLQADIGCAFYGLLALACLVQYRRTGGKALPLLAGVFAGVTLTYKYQSVLIVAVLTAFLLVPERLLRDRRAAVWS